MTGFFYLPIMKFKLHLIFFISLLFFFNCRGSKNSNNTRNSLSLEAIRPYEKCSDILPIIEYTKGINLLNDLEGLSYSTAYNSIYTPYTIVADSVQKDSIRYLYAKRIKRLVTIAFPKIEITNESTILSKNYQFIVENANNVLINTNAKSSIKNLITNTNISKKQLLIYNSSTINKNKLRITVRFLIFDLKKYKVIYKDVFQYNCDIRDYNSLEKAITYGLLKLKLNSE